MPELNKAGARKIVGDMDRIAALLLEEHESLGIPARMARHVAHSIDQCSDMVDRKAGIQRNAEGIEIKAGDGSDQPPVKDENVTEDHSGGFDPAEIGQEDATPPQTEPDEPYMKDNFIQEEFDQLRGLYESGMLSPRAAFLKDVRQKVHEAAIKYVKAARGKTGTSDPSVALDGAAADLAPVRDSLQKARAILEASVSELKKVGQLQEEETAVLNKLSGDILPALRAKEEAVSGAINSIIAFQAKFRTTAPGGDVSEAVGSMLDTECLPRVGRIVLVVNELLDYLDPICKGIEVNLRSLKLASVKEQAVKQAGLLSALADFWANMQENIGKLVSICANAGARVKAEVAAIDATFDEATKVMTPPGKTAKGGPPPFIKEKKDEEKEEKDEEKGKGEEEEKDEEEEGKKKAQFEHGYDLSA